MGIADWFSSSTASGSSSSSSGERITPSAPSKAADAVYAPAPPTPSSSSSMAGQAAQGKVQTSQKLKNPLNPEGIKPCCACPTTKSARDDCFLRSGLDPTSEEGQARCRDVVERHRECMRGLGFKV